MPNKGADSNRIPVIDLKPAMASAQLGTAAKVTTPVVKAAVCKAASKDLPMSPTQPAPESERPELLGSLTTQQQQRTSARVIKKLRLDPAADKDVKTKRADGQSEERAECETPNKIGDKDPLKFPTGKQRMPKALWSIEEKNLFFEALNEYGKDFDMIKSHICAKMKKKGMTDVNLKTKTQVSHFYYRTWHKLSKHVHFDENVKKVAQELYALINYGELRKKVPCINEKTCARLGEMVRCGSITVRVRGRNLRVRTPSCRALRKLNQITERVYASRVCGRACCVLRARDAAAWARVQAAAHNPRAVVALPLRTRLQEFVRELSERWTPPPYYKPETNIDNLDEQTKEDDALESNRTPDDQPGDGDDELHMEADRVIVNEQKLPKKPVLHVGPKPSAEIHLPVVNPNEQLSSQKICFASYLERMCSQGQDKDGNSKIRTPKRQRKDSTTEKDKEAEQKKFKSDDSDMNKLMHIDETAIDGIELMANYKNILEDEEKPSTEDEKELKSEETADEADTGLDKDLERDKDGETEKDISEMLEKDKDSFSEMEDDEKCETDNESDQGKNDNKTGKTKFKNLKVKFRIRPKNRGGSVYTLVLDKDQDVQESKPEGIKPEDAKPEEEKPDFDVEMAVKQIRKGWSEYDAGDLLIGDLYLMFGSRSKLELDYWWAEPTPPLPQPPQKSSKLETIDKDKPIEKKEKADGSVEESDTDIFSPKHAFSHDSNDALSGDERKGEQLASPEHKSSVSSASFKLVSKLINRPQPAPPANSNGMALLSDRLKRLLAMVGNPHVSANSGAAPPRCGCGGVCAHRRAPQQKHQSYGASPAAPPPSVGPAPVFRHPTPIAPKPDCELQKSMNLAGVPRWRRGRPRLADRRVVVQRLLPLLPKLPPPNNLIPVKIVPNTPPAPPKILPKPPPTSTSDLSFFYVLSESNGQFYFHDGDRRIPITPLPNLDGTAQEDTRPIKPEGDVKDDVIPVSDEAEPSGNGACHPEVAETREGDGAVAKKPAATVSNGEKKPESADIGNFLPSESMSLSPSRLLRETDGWFEGSVQDFSLSSFLGHLEGRAQPELAVDSQLHSLMAESSVDYVAKFADLAAEVTDEVNHLDKDLT